MLKYQDKIFADVTIIIIMLKQKLMQHLFSFFFIFLIFKWEYISVIYHSTKNSYQLIRSNNYTFKYLKNHKTSDR